MTDGEFEAVLDGLIPPGIYDYAFTKKSLASLEKLDAASRQSLLTLVLGKLHVFRGETITFRARCVANDLLRAGTIVDHSTVADLLDAQASLKYPFQFLPLAGLVDWAEHHENHGGLSVRLLTCMRKHLPVLKKMARDKDHRQLMHRLEVAVKLVDGWVIPGVRDGWTAVALARRDSLPPDSRALWVALIEAAAKQESSKPGKAYLKEAGKIAAALPEFEAIMHEILESLGRDGPVCVQRFGYVIDKKQLLDDDHTSLLRALIWLCIQYHDLAGPLRSAAERCYAKIKNIGPLSAKIAAACAYVLSQQETSVSARSVLELQTSTKHKSTRKSIGKAISNLTSRTGISRDELEETTVPDHGFSTSHPPSQLIANETVHLAVSNSGQPVLLLPNAAGDRQSKSAEAKALLREVRRTWRQEVRRLERLMCSGRAVSADVWLKHYWNQPITGLICRRLLWKADDASFGFEPAKSEYGKWLMVGLNGSAVEISGNEQIRLWHPCEISESERQAWERRVLNSRLLQPFQQAQRAAFEVLTGSEHQTDDIRFAGESIHQGTFAALCRERAWNYSFHGGKEQYEPFREFQESGLRAALRVDYAEDVTWLNISGLRFYAGKSEAPLPLAKVPAIHFSEAMRDIDLFISASRGKGAEGTGTIPNAEK